MSHLIKHLLIMSAFISAGLVTRGIARADEPGTVTIKQQIIVGNPRRPVVTVELSRQRPDIPLHVMTHPLDKHPAAPTP